jgi:hypothetical protein
MTPSPDTDTVHTHVEHSSNVLIFIPVQRTYAEEIAKLSKQNCGHHNFLLKHGLDII